MIKVEYCKGDLKIRLSMPESVFINNSNKIYTLLSGVLDSLSSSIEQKQDKESVNSMPLRGNTSDKVFNIRERIPNVAKDDAIKIQQPKMEKALVRCPQCGQGTMAIVEINDEEKRLMLKKGDEFKTTNVIIKNDEELKKMVFPKSRKKPGDNIKALKEYYSDIVENTTIVEEEKDMFVAEDTKLYCPCCKESSRFKDWKNTYDNPEERFGYTDVCDICGGEVEAVVKKDGTKLICSVCKTEVKTL